MLKLKSCTRLLDNEVLLLRKRKEKEENKADHVIGDVEHCRLVSVHKNENWASLPNGLFGLLGVV